MSRRWVQEVFHTVQESLDRDPYFRGLVGGFNLRLVYVVRSIPVGLRESYGGSKAFVSVQVSKGAIRGFDVGGEMPTAEHQVLLASDYETAKQLLLGESSPVSLFYTRRLTVRASDRFRQWPRHVPKAIVTAKLILKLARCVPTVFATRA